MREFLKKKLNRWMMAVMLVVMSVGATLGVLVNQTVGTMAATNDNGETPISFTDKESVMELIYEQRDKDAKLVILELLPAKEMSIFHMLTYDKLVYNRLNSQETLAKMYDQYNAKNDVFTVAGTIAYYHPFTIIKNDDNTYTANYPNFFIDEILDAATYPEVYDYFTERNPDGSYKHLEVRTFIPGELEQLYQKGTSYLEEAIKDVSLIYISDRLQNTEVAKFNMFMEGLYTDDQFKNNVDVNSLGIMANCYKKSGSTFAQVPMNQLNQATYDCYFKTDKKVIGNTNFSSPYFSAFSDAVLVKANETKTITFKNYTDGVQNWNNFMVMLQDASLGALPLNDQVTVARADKWGWIGVNDTAHNFSSMGVGQYYSGNINTIKTDLNGATVTVTITNNNNTTAEIIMDIVTAGGAKIREAYTNIPITGEINYWLSCEKSYLETEEYIPCDFSWDCAEHLIRYIYGGSPYTKTKNVADELVSAPVSVVFNWGGQSKALNMFRFINTLCKTSNVNGDKVNGVSTYYDDVLKNNVNRVKSTTIGSVSIKDYYRNDKNLLTGEFVYGEKRSVNWEDTSIPMLQLDWSCSGEYAYNYVFKNSNANDSIYMMGSRYQSSWVENNSGGTANERIKIDSNGGYLVSGVVSYFLGADPTDKKTVRVLEIEPCQDFTYNYAAAKNDTEKNTKFEAIRDLGISLHMKDYYHITTGAGEFNSSSYDYFLKNGGDPRFEFTCVTTSDFNGMNDELISTFDVIVVGTNTGLMNTTSEWVNGVQVFKPQYNDTSLNGYIYLAYGDLVKVDTTILGLNPNDFVFAGSSVPAGFVERNTVTDLSSLYAGCANWIFNANNSKVWTQGMNLYFAGKNGFYVPRNVKDYYKNIKNYSTSESYYADSVGNARYKDNDITQKKQNELLDYAKAGGTILLDNSVYNTSVVYPTANLAKLVNAVKNPSNGCNAIVKKSEMMTQMVRALRRTTFAINEFTVYEDAEHTKVIPSIGYDSNDMIDIDKRSSAHTFFYEVDVTTRAEKGYTYSLEFLIDQNADGMFDHDIAENELVELFYKTSKVKNGKNSFKINLPNDYNGMFYWRIQIDEFKDGKLTDRCITEASNVVVGDEKNIKVLQILSNDPNVANASNTKPATGWAPSGVSLNMQNDKAFQDLLNMAANEINYQIQVDTITARDFEEEFEKLADAGIPYVFGDSYDTPSDYLMSNGYSMVVIGFSDSYGYDDISDECGAASCIADFIDHGNSVLFTHDTMGFSTSPNKRLTYTMSKNGIDVTGSYTGSTDLVRVLREKVGVDRYDVTLNYQGNEYVPTTISGDRITEIGGWTDHVLNNKAIMGSGEAFDGIRWNAAGTYGSKNKGFTYGKTINTKNYVGNLTETTQVTQVNQGQITMYPYHVSNVGETTNVSLTHSQYWQVDLEDKDVVVWYTLSSNTEGNYYGDDKKDAANNYYIFSKGNVTYSGAGHRSLSTPEAADGNYSSPIYDELKLFVNTVIRAAVAGTYTNTITVTNGSPSTATYSVLDETGKELENKADSFVVYCTDLNDVIDVDFMALNQGLTNQGVLEQVVADTTKIPGLLSKYRSLDIYYLEQVNGSTLKVSGKFAEYDRTILVADDEGFHRSVYLNGEERTFTIYDPEKSAYALDLPTDEQEAYKDMMAQCYSEAKTSYSFLYIVAKDANGTTDTTVVKVLSRALSDLD